MNATSGDSLSRPRRPAGGLLLALALAAGCNRDTQSRASAEAAPAPADSSQAQSPDTLQVPSVEATAQMLAPWTGDLDGMVERRYVRMLVTFSRTNYFLDKATQRGITYEAGKMFEDFLNKRLGSKTIRVHVAFIPVTRDRIFQALAEGRGDIAAANLTITPERLKLVDFATPFARDVRQVAVTAPGQPPVASPTDLSGREVHIRRSSAAFQNLTALNETLNAAGKPPVNIVEASEVLEDEDILEMVNASVIPATVVNAHTADLWTGLLPEIAVHRDAPVHTGGEIAWALRRGAPRLREVVDAFAAANAQGSLNFNMLFKRYYTSNQWIRNPASEAELRKFRNAVELFRRYGGQYELPWLLVAAQAYQESQIDQSRVSSAGAVGVMQIKPSTAAGAPISITGVDTSMQRNIEAGVKYLRFIVDRYYENEPMEKLDKGLFAVASYNAGPARVAGLRRKARAMGLDPNKWFGNVEIVAAREIGRETVVYVSNIYKYYVAYTMLAQQMEMRRKAQ